jgi:hypothetical protein
MTVSHEATYNRRRACAASLRSGSVESDCFTTGFMISERPAEAIDLGRTRSHL